MGDPIGTAANLFHDGIAWLQALLPGGFGLLIIPLGVLGLLSLLIVRPAPAVVSSSLANWRAAARVSKDTRFQAPPRCSITARMLI